MTSADSRVDAFERFFLAEHPKLVALGLAWTGNRDTARELAQETLVRALESWDRVAELEVPGAWARRVMINLLIDQHRSRGRLVAMTDRIRRQLRSAAPDRGGAPDEHDRWWRAVRELPDRERAAVTLHYLEDLPIAEVARVLDVAPGTVKASLSHAREKLRIVLSEPEDER